MAVDLRAQVRLFTIAASRGVHWWPFARLIPGPHQLDNELGSIAGELSAKLVTGQCLQAPLNRKFNSLPEASIPRQSGSRRHKNVVNRNLNAAFAIGDSVHHTGLINQFTLWIDRKEWRANQPKISREAGPLSEQFCNSPQCVMWALNV
ncbi:hypothetical protein [Caballeronia grimmiae]|uniref:hypothetical protein n=1 Tax=Caballeronia grimmiae TaxID=1071679 RepID=UPI0038BBCCBE